MTKPSKPMKSDTKKAGTDVMQRGGQAKLTTDVQRKIGTQLRSMYDDVVKQGVPDRFSQLLSQLDEQTEQEKK
jgi:hypothetical protein